MTGKREDLDELLCQTLGSDKVYFQPSENLKIKYPCIIYSLSGFYSLRADNRNYHRDGEYDMVYITQNPDDPMIETIEDLPFCSMGRPYTSENLHHYPYTIYY